MRAKACGVIAALLLMSLTNAVWAQDVGGVPQTNPAYYALTGATVVVGNGQVIQNGTIVIRDGLIESVGASSPPAGAWIFDVSGMHVYPGLIDALAEVGDARQAQRGRQGGGESRQRGSDSGSDEGPGYFAHVSAANLIEANAESHAAWRDQGILTRHLSPAEGIFRGTTAVINLNGQEPDQMLVQGEVAMAMSFDSAGFATYPGSLMGVIAHIRQTLSDAVHYRDSWEIYRTNRRGIARPEINRTLQALGPVIEGELPLLFPAKREREMRRAIDMCRQFNARCMVAGGFEADRLSDTLKDSGSPVLVSLNFPKKQRDRHPEAEEDTSDIRYRVHARAVAGELAEAGIPFAFYSDGASSRDFLENLRQAVERGLSKEAAIRAATLGAAEILGIADMLGSVEPGKIANLVVADNDLFEEDSSIKQTFVDGRRFPVVERPAAEGAGRGRPGGPPAELGGSWEVQVFAGQETLNVEFDLAQNGRDLTGQVLTDQGSLPIRAGRVSGDRFSFKLSINLQGAPTEVSVSGTVSGNSLRGSADLGGGQAAPLEGNRRPGA